MQNQQSQPASEPVQPPKAPLVFDDSLKAVQEPPSDTPGTGPVLSGFVITKLQKLEKPRLEEVLVEPDGGSGCVCNSVCACVPVETCACNQVCTCDTVATCQSYSSGCYGGGGGYGGYYLPCY